MRGRVFRILLAGTVEGALVLALSVLMLFPEGMGYFEPSDLSYGLENPDR